MMVIDDHHRPWPLPAGPWVMAQSWHDLLFAHWPIPAAVMRALLPPQLVLDTYDGMAWVGVVPFRMSGVRPRLCPPVPWLSTFPELNVRTYVRSRDPANPRPGVYFFSLEAANPLAVAIARGWFKLPYYNATMSLRADGQGIHYRSQRTHRGAPAAEFVGSYRPTGPVYHAQPGTLEHWLTERYSLYTVSPKGAVPNGRAYIGEIHHQPWPLQPAEAEIQRNSMAVASALDLPNVAPLLHFARRLDVVIWPLRVVE